MLIADKMKSLMIQRRAIKGSLIVEEVGLPIDKSWTKSLRADLMEISNKDKVTIYEIKSSMADYRSDKKWEGYLNHAELLYFIAPKEVAKVIKEETPGKVGVYELWDCGYLNCIRIARKTGYEPDVKMIREKLNIQLAYRYAKIHSNRLKLDKKEQDEKLQS